MLSLHLRLRLRLRLRSRLPLLRGLLLGLVVFTSPFTPAYAAEEDPAELDKAWKEVALALPAAPLDQNLLPFYVSPTASLQFAIDGASIVVSKDGVVRYTLVSRSPEGAKNVSFEGIRCEFLQVRIYAFGRADGSWSRSRREAWEAIVPHSRNRPHAELASGLLCADGLVAGSAEQMRSRLANSNIRSAQDHIDTRVVGQGAN